MEVSQRVSWILSLLGSSYPGPERSRCSKLHIQSSLPKGTILALINCQKRGPSECSGLSTSRSSSQLVRTRRNVIPREND